MAKDADDKKIKEVPNGCTYVVEKFEGRVWMDYQSNHYRWEVFEDGVRFAQGQCHNYALAVKCCKAVVDSHV